MIQQVFNKLAIPDTCHLGKRVFKKLFHEHADLTATDKRALSEDVDTITWQYTLKPNTIPVPAYEDDEREYHEIAVLQVDLKTQQRTTRIAEVVHRAVPYPVILLLGYTDTEQSTASTILSVAHKRFSQAERGAIVVEEFRHSPWLHPNTAPDGDNTLSLQQAFLDSLALPQLPKTHLFALYSALVDRVIALEAARLTGAYTLKDAAEQRAERRQRLSQCRAIEGQIADLRATLKKEGQFNRQVELNTQIKQLEADLGRLANGL